MKDNVERSIRFDWNHVASMATILAVILAFPIYLGNKIDNLRENMDCKFACMTTQFDNLKVSIDADLRSFQYEMRDIHGRLSACEKTIAFLEDKDD